jgi:mannosylglycerate synthase
MMSLVVFPFKDEPDDLVARNISVAAGHERVVEVWGLADPGRPLTAELTDAIDGIAETTAKPVSLHVEERIGRLRPGKGDAMNTAIAMAASRGFDRAHFYDADITNFEPSWIEGAERAADEGFGVVRHRFARAATDAMITWMITRPGLAMLFPGTVLPGIDQPLGGELLLTAPALEALSGSDLARNRSDWGIDTILTYLTATLELGLYEHNVPDGKRHALYGSLDDLRTMAVECLDAVASLRGLPHPVPGRHAAEPSTPVPDDLASTSGFDIDKTLGLLVSGWSETEEALARDLPQPLPRLVLENRSEPAFAFMDADAWGVSLRHLLDRFRLGEPAWEALAFRLWVMRVLSYATNEATGGYEAAISYLIGTIAGYEAGAGDEPSGGDEPDG